MKPTPIYVNVTGGTGSGKSVAMSFIHQALIDSKLFENITVDEEGHVLIAEFRRECK